jgi:histidine ammonia-lyase
MMDPKFTGLALGIQSAAGFGITIVSPAVFGAVLELYNGAVVPTSATQWWPSFGVLGAGGMLAPIAILLLRRMPQAVLMAGGKR